MPSTAGDCSGFVVASAMRIARGRYTLADLNLGRVYGWPIRPLEPTMMPNASWGGVRGLGGWAWDTVGR